MHLMNALDLEKLKIIIKDKLKPMKNPMSGKNEQ